MERIGIDLGGTNVKGVRIDQLGNINDQVSIPIKSTGWKEAVQHAVKHLRTDSSIATIGLAAPGLPDPNNHMIQFMPGRLDGLEGFDWSAYVGCDVHVLNDAHAALLAEMHLGKAKGLQDVILLTLGTGVGGALLIGGKLHRGMLQRAGSIGDMSLDAESEEIGFLKVPGTLENALGDESVGLRSGGRFLSTKELVLAYRHGDEGASEVWLRSVKKLSVALCSLINILAPQQIILGGGIAQADDALFDPLTGYMNRYEWRPDGKATAVVKATFHEYAGAIGAACWNV